MANQKRERKTSAAVPQPKRLYRSGYDRMIAGVCGGFAEYLEIDSTIIRIIWLIACFMGGIGVVAYLACLLVMQENPEHTDKEAIEKRKPRNTALIWGVILILLGIAFLSHQWGFFYFRPLHWRFYQPWFFQWDLFLPLLIILFGVLYIVHVLKKEKAGKVETSGKTQTSEARKLTRSLREKMIAGVCGGLGQYLNIDPTIVRVGWILITLFSGILLGVLAYIILLFIIPEEEEVKTSP